MIDSLSQWAHEKASVLAAITVGALMTTAIGWRSPAVAIRQMIAGLGGGYYFGPAVHFMLLKFAPFPAENVEGMAYCATAISGLWIVEGIVLAAKRWAANPSLPKV